ncbi:unnamed protein product [Brachionus calyciflorus]|uniref:Uncharacterized protein n=1 Tax=Brachionus calyciflorus TaxID=104777 RepID=A0A813WR18_9BILA|nr:unnamed protein product [Brachionus calyciflorus]
MIASNTKTPKRVLSPSSEIYGNSAKIAEIEVEEQNVIEKIQIGTSTLETKEDVIQMIDFVQESIQKILLKTARECHKIIIKKELILQNWN